MGQACHRTSSDRQDCANPAGRIVSGRGKRTIRVTDIIEKPDGSYETVERDAPEDDLSKEWMIAAYRGAAEIAEEYMDKQGGTRSKGGQRHKDDWNANKDADYQRAVKEAPPELSNLEAAKWIKKRPLEYKVLAALTERVISDALGQKYGRNQVKQKK